MTPTRDLETVVSTQNGPSELRRPVGIQRSEENRTASRMCGVIPPRQQDGVISPCMLRRNLVIPVAGAADAGGLLLLQ